MAAKKSTELERLDNWIERITEFLKLWVQFERMVRDAHHGLRLKADEERHFLQLKSQVARTHQFLMDMLGREYVASDRVTGILQRCVTLRQLSQTRDDNYFNNIQHEWNLRYMHLQETLAIMQYQRDKLTPAPR